MTISASDVSVPIRHTDRFFIGGEWVAPSSDSTITVIDSHTEQAYLTVAEAQAADALELMFAAIGIAVDRYRDDTRFYRAALSTRDGGLDQPMVAAAHRPRQAFWNNLIARAVAEGLLRAETDAERLGVVLIQISGGAHSRWILNLIGLDELELEMSYGFAAVLLAFASRAARPRLSAKLAEMAAALAAQRPREAVQAH